MELEKAYREGELAAERGQWEDECPYAYESPEYEAWIDGYQDRDITLAAEIEES